jgi:hypothetical protein
MATKTADRRTKRLPRVTVPEAAAGPLAGALVGYGVFAILVIVIAALFAGDNFSLPSKDWQSLGFGASALAGLLLFVGYTYGGFVAGRLAGAGRKGLHLGIAVFAAGIVLALFTGWAISAGTTGDQRDSLEAVLRTLGAPGSSDWGDIGTAAGIASVAGMLLGSVAGGSLAERRSARVTATG